MYFDLLMLTLFSLWFISFFFLCVCFSSSFQVIVLFEISYKSPDDEAGNFEPRHLVDPIQRQYHHIHGHSESLDDDQQKLLDIEQNIANLEKNLIRGIEKSTYIKSI